MLSQPQTQISSDQDEYLDSCSIPQDYAFLEYQKNFLDEIYKLDMNLS